MNLLKYNKKYAFNAFGLRRIGPTCYFNTFLQAILSCPSIVETFLTKSKSYPFNQSNVAQLLCNLMKNGMKIENSGNTKVLLNNHILFVQMIKSLGTKTFGIGQEDFDEALHMFLSSLEANFNTNITQFQEVENLLLHRRQTNILCHECQKWISTTKEENIILYVEPTLEVKQLDKFKSIDKNYGKSLPLNEFLCKYTGFVDSNFKCTNKKCQKRGEKYKESKLTMVPEVLIVVSKKFNNNNQKVKYLTPFPEKLTFTAKNKKDKLIYEAVAQVEHRGNTKGGHYFAICKRKNGWYVLNDTLVTPGKFKPTAETYAVLYHIV